MHHNPRLNFPTLAAHIQTLNLAKDHARGISPAQAAFSSVSALLDTTKVYYSLLCDEFPTDARLGFHGRRSGVRRPWNILR
jgi:hypothetical protein